jgi:hypothetical protein
LVAKRLGRSRRAREGKQPLPKTLWKGERRQQISPIIAKLDLLLAIKSELGFHESIRKRLFELFKKWGFYE